ncbi:hypothetical protein DL98DRAFT_631694 [Cadophora sp. DSE1049]|nr:hypothetical protein DL98DRAFT_631694 [Cadophora sp. DSE1049]
MPPLPKSAYNKNALNTIINCEFNAISLIQRKTRIPVLQIHALEVKSSYSVKALFILIDCLESNIRIDLGIKIPPEYKQAFLSSLVKIYVNKGILQLPKIRTILSTKGDST